MVVVAAMAIMLIGATAFATDSAFAGGDGHKKKYGKSQAISQVNGCGMDSGQRMLHVRILLHRFRATITE